MQKSIKNIRPEDELLFACTRQEFFEQHKNMVFDICSNKELNWSVVYSTAELHGVAPLVYSNLKKCTDINVKIPQRIMKNFQGSFYRNYFIKKIRMEKLTEALAFLNRKNIDVMLIKGFVLDILVYDYIWATSSGDIDLILKIREEMVDREVSEVWSVIEKLWGFIELDIFSHHDIDNGGVLPINFQGIWDRARKINYRGYDVFIMSPEDMLISMCINSLRKRYFRLKTLCDIAEITKKYKNLNWEDVTSKAKEYHCNNIIYTALIITKMTLGCEFPEDVLYKLKVNPVRAKIISYLGQRMSFSSLSSLYSGINFLSINVNLFLTLTYATYSPYQVWRNMQTVYTRIIKEYNRRQKLKMRKLDI